MSIRFVLLFLMCLAAPVSAATYRVDYSGIVGQSSGSSMPPLGSELFGNLILDDDPLAYSPAEGTTQTPNYIAYQLIGPPYESSITLPSTAFSTSFISVEVFDNDLSLLGMSEPGDAIALSAKRDGFSYILLLRGPASTFSGTSVPSPALIGSSWASAVVFAWDSSLQSFSANVTALSVSPVPEPAVQALFVLGLACLALRRRARDA